MLISFLRTVVLYLLLIVTVRLMGKRQIGDSMVHEDFMIGSADLSIDAHTRDGRTVPIFRDGNWAF